MCHDRFMLNAGEPFAKSAPSEHYWMVLDGVDPARASNIHPVDIWKLNKMEAFELCDGTRTAPQKRFEKAHYSVSHLSLRVDVPHLPMLIPVEAL